MGEEIREKISEESWHLKFSSFDAANTCVYVKSGWEVPLQPSECEFLNRDREGFLCNLHAALAGVCVSWSVLSCNFILLFPSSGAALGFTLGTDIKGFGLCHFLEFVECSDGACFYPSKSLKSKSLLTYIDMGGWWVVAGTEATSWRKINAFSSCYFVGFFLFSFLPSVHAYVCAWLLGLQMSGSVTESWILNPFSLDDFIDLKIKGWMRH